MDKRHVLFALIIVVAGFSTIFYFSNLRKTGVSEGDNALDFNMATLDGSTFRLSEQKGKLTLLDFASTTCPYCVEEFKALREVASQPGVVVVTINLDDSNATYLRSFAANNGISWPIGTGIKAGIDYQVNGVPTLILIDKSGVIRYRNFYTTLDSIKQLLLVYR